MLISVDGELACDLCGRRLKTRFTYYSAKILKIDVDVTQKKTTSVDENVDLDVCPECYDEWMKKVRDQLARRKT